MNISKMQAVIQTGVPELDRDHARLLQCLQEASATITGHGRKGNVLQALTALRFLCEEHFVREEGIMQSVNYVDADAHVKLHRTEIDYLNSMIESLESGEQANLTRSISAIATWVHEHIRTMDMDLAAAVKQHRRRR